MQFHPTEPTSDLRQAANGLRQMYVALVEEGFTDQQALAILGQMLAGQQGSS